MPKILLVATFLLIFDNLLLSKDNFNYNQIEIEFEKAKALRQDDPNKAEKEFQRIAQVINHNYPDSLIFLSDVFYFGGRNYYVQDNKRSFQKADSCFNHSIQLRKGIGVLDYRLVNSFYQIAVCNSKINLVNKANDYIDSAFVFFDKEMLNDNSTLLAELYLAKGDFYELKGDYFEAEKNFRNAEQKLNVIKSDSDKNYRVWCESINRLGIVLELQNKLDQAILCYEILDTTDTYIDKFYPNWIICLEKKAEYSKALALNKLLEQEIKSYSYKELKDYGLLDHLPRILINYGWIYWRLNDNQKALNYLKKAKPLIKSQNQLFNYYDNIADVYESMNENDSALVNYHLALQLMVSDYKTDIYIIAPNISSKTIFKADYLDLVEVLISKSNLLQKIGGLKDDIAFKEAALQHYLQLDKVYDYINIYTESDHSKLEIAKNTKEAFEMAQNLTFELFQKNKSKELFNMELLFMEKSKSIVMQQLLKGLDSESVLPDSLVNTLKTYRQEIGQLDIVSAVNDDYEIDRLLIKKRLELDSFLYQLENNYSLYKARKETNYTISIDEIQSQLLQHDQAIIEFFEGENALYRIWVNQNDYGFDRFDIDNNYKQGLLDFYQNLQSNTNLSIINQKGYKWYKLLLPSILEDSEIQRLLIIPDGNLAFIPFDALSVKEGQPYADNFVLNKYSIGYAFSLNTYQFRLDKKSNKSVVFSPNYKNSEWEELRFSKKASTKISQIINSKLVKGKEASKSKFNDEASQYGVIHLSMHGFVNFEDAWQSELIFSPRIEDNILTIGEVYKKNGLQAELLYLSACETGAGILFNGEGIMSFDRAFKSIGVESLITARWKEDDFVSSKIAVSFYKNLREGYPKDVALNLAKQQYIKDGDNLHPSFWAGTVCIGNLDTINFDKNGFPKRLLVIIIGFLVILLFLYLFITSRNSKPHEFFKLF